MRNRHPDARVTMVAVLVLTGLGLSACHDGRPGRNHPRDRDHQGEHHRYMAPN